MVFVKMSSSEIQFESQTKSKLNNMEAQSAVYAVVKAQLETYLEEHPGEARKCSKPNSPPVLVWQLALLATRWCAKASSKAQPARPS